MFMVLFGLSWIYLSAVPVKIDDSTNLDLGSIFRSYYVNDQRIQWSGVEATFGVEAALSAEITKKIKNGKIEVLAEIFLNQPFDGNILVDEQRVRYLPNFEISACEIAQLYIGVSKGDFSIALGRGETVFGKNYSLPISNSYFAQPFFRTEAILMYETGLFLKYSPGIFDFALAVVNGGPQMDTNSSKAGIVRFGLKGKNWAVGVSAKAQDGIGSEQQKQYKNHVGMDLMFKIGRLLFSAEVIYDQYGFRKEFDEADIFWKRSLYYRDVFFEYETPVTGTGGYVNLQYEAPSWFIEVNFGQYYPEEIGYLFHDDPITRAIIKLRVRLAPRFFLYGMGLFENERVSEALFSGASPYAFLLGLKYNLD